MTIELIEYLSQFITSQRLNRIAEILSTRTRYLTVVLENIYHSYNASAVLRTCECFGIQDLYFIESLHKFKPARGIVLGAANWINTHSYQDSFSCLQALKTQGYQIVATSLRPDSKLIEEIDITQKTALCFGNEESGIGEAIHQLADHQIYIPMYGFTQSLNISVSTGLTIYAFIKKIHQSSIAWQLTDEEKNKITLEWLMNSVPNSELLVTKFKSSLLK
ncbi:MAG: hypothetical protein A3E87_06385 [Gammaproteobacteria bacterium RIFCSPHIGHO2_12_FULL_35_23]|nr:MAG: hypothetical protein A3E87_06385 [Gammaproteobacteria bacterium RIFCSPHIGHO2_12_FULL_35_23]